MRKSHRIESLEGRRLLAGSPQLVGDIDTQIDQLSPTGPAVQAGNVTYFAAHPTGTDGPELFLTNGTAGGTKLVRDINPAGGSQPQSLTAVGSVLYFTADDGVTGRELWKSDGTSAGTVRVADLRAGAASSTPSNLTNVNGTLYFTASTGGAAQLFKATASGAVAVSDLTGGTAFSSPAALAAVGNTLVFSGLKNG